MNVSRSRKSANGKMTHPQTNPTDDAATTDIPSYVLGYEPFIEAIQISRSTLGKVF